MIEHKCENCAHYCILDYQDNQKYCAFQDCEIKHTCDDYFQPKEELVRQDEKNKILSLLEMDLENEKKAYDEYKQFKGIQIEETALIDYIRHLIMRIKEGDNK